MRMDSIFQGLDGSEMPSEIPRGMDSITDKEGTRLVLPYIHLLNDGDQFIIKLEKNSDNEGKFKIDYYKGAQ